jgi:hypothetical protein
MVAGGTAAGAFSPAAALPFLAVFIYKINILALSVTYGDSSPKGRALGIAAKFPVKP